MPIVLFPSEVFIIDTINRYDQLFRKENNKMTTKSNK